MQQLYETLLIITPEADDEAVNAVLGGIRKNIEDADGRVLDMDIWGKRKLAYEVRNKTDGIYVLVHAEGPPELPGDLKARMRLDEAIIRHMMVRVEEEMAEAIRAEAEERAGDEEKAAKEQLAAARRRADAAAEAALRPVGEVGDQADPGEAVITEEEPEEEEAEADEEQASGDEDEEREPSDDEDEEDEGQDEDEDEEDDEDEDADEEDEDEDDDEDEDADEEDEDEADEEDDDEERES